MNNIIERLSDFRSNDAALYAVNSALAIVLNMQLDLAPENVVKSSRVNKPLPRKTIIRPSKWWLNPQCRSKAPNKPLPPTPKIEAIPEYHPTSLRSGQVRMATPRPVSKCVPVSQLKPRTRIRCACHQPNASIYALSWNNHIYTKMHEAFITEFPHLHNTYTIVN